MWEHACCFCVDFSNESPAYPSASNIQSAANSIYKGKVSYGETKLYHIRVAGNKLAARYMHLLKSEGLLHIHNLALKPNFNNLHEEFSLTKYFRMEVQCVLWVAETKFHILFRWGSYIKGYALAQVVRVSPRRLGFYSGPVHVSFVVAKTALEPVLIRIF